MKASSEEQEGGQVWVRVIDLIKYHKLPNLVLMMVVQVQILVDKIVALHLKHSDYIVCSIALTVLLKAFAVLFLEILA